MNYVFKDVKNSIRTLKISAPLGSGIYLCNLYILANVAFFAYVVVPHFLLYRAATKEEIKNSNVTVASFVFRECIWDQSGEGAFGYCCVEVISYLLISQGGF
jgi:hypothetical protein